MLWVNKKLQPENPGPDLILHMHPSMTMVPILRFQQESNWCSQAGKSFSLTFVTCICKKNSSRCELKAGKQIVHTAGQFAPCLAVNKTPGL